MDDFDSDDDEDAEESKSQAKQVNLNDFLNEDDSE